jgi:uncharacterized membrane protein
MKIGRQAASPGSLQRAGWLAFSLLAIGGMGIALYLTVVRFTGGDIYCTMGDGCKMVNSSQYSKLGPFPVALLGSLFYAGLLELGIVALFWGFRWVAPLVLAATLFGLGFSLYLTYIELVVIHAICMWCVASLAVMSALTLIATLQVVLPRVRRRGQLVAAAEMSQQSPAVVGGKGIAVVWTEKERLG